MMKSNKSIGFVFGLSCLLFLYLPLAYATPPLQTDSVANCEQGLALYPDDKEAALPYT